MARSRNIKPGFFVNADLVELPPLVRLLFIGLWTIADRDGRLEDRPSQIKMQVLPGDDINTMQALDMLCAKHFLERYSVGGKDFLQINNFSKHQNPHIKEPKSVIPPPPEQQETIEIVEGNTNTIPASCKHRSCLILAGLIPDSLNLIPDSPSPSIEKMTMKEFSLLYYQTFSKIMPPMLNEDAREACNRYPPETIKEAFQISAEAGAKSWAYTKKVLEQKPFDDSLESRMDEARKRFGLEGA